jgi:hypothetical protein
LWMFLVAEKIYPDIETIASRDCRSILLGEVLYEWV